MEENDEVVTLENESDFYDEKDFDEEPKEDVENDVKETLEEDNAEADAGIFDEDLIKGIEDVASDFRIADTMLSVASPVHSWQGQNLEEVIEKEQIEKDWGDEKNLVGGEIYRTDSDSDDSVYGANFLGSDIYKDGVMKGPYDENSTDSVYDVTASSRDGGKMYDPGRSKKRDYGEMMDRRRKDKLFIKNSDYDGDGREFRDFRTDIKYDTKNG